MSVQQRLTVETVSEIFREEIASRLGVVNDAFQDGTRLFARSVLPGVEEVRPGDRLQGGVVLRATELDIWLHPYVFRQVCRNGAIMARALRTRYLTELDLRDSWDVEAALREAIQDCCEAEAFTESVREFRSATEVQADLALVSPTARSDTGRKSPSKPHVLSLANSADCSCHENKTVLVKTAKQVESVWKKTPSSRDSH